MNAHEIEDLHHGDGYRNESQRVHSVSTNALRNQNAKKEMLIDGLLAVGRYVVKLTGPEYCPHTDATIGNRIVFSHYDERWQAERAAEIQADEEISIEVLPRLRGNA